jgi:hypothetical protein
VRSVLAGVVLLVGALLVPVATAGWWARETLVPTHAYVDTVAPLASNPAITSAVEHQVVDRTMAAVEQRAPQLPSFIRSRLRPLVRTAVNRAVESPAFERAWRDANRAAHRQLVAVLSGRSSAVQKSGGDAVVEVHLDAVTGALRRDLAKAGVPFDIQLPDATASIPIGSARQLDRAQLAYRLLVRWGRPLPVLAVILIVVGLVLARRRAGALAWTAVVALLGLGGLAVLLFIGRESYLHALPAGISSAAGKAIFDTVTSGLRHDLEVVAIGAAVVLIVSAAVAVIRRP